MEHNHNHHHGHHHHDHSNISHYNKAFAVGIALNISFVIIEIIYGLTANSSALLADAGHNAGDVLSLVFAWFGVWMTTKKPNGKFTYGYKKSTILISLINALMLFGAVIAIAIDAIEKLKNPEPVAGIQVMIVAGIGVLINAATAIMFMRGQKDDLNIKGAFLHMAADAGVSLGVVISGLLIAITNIQWIDFVMTALIILVILWGTWKLFIESVRLALDAVPNSINLEEIKHSLLNASGVEDIHDLHLWAMSTNENALSVHVITSLTKTDDFLRSLQTLLAKKYNIKHTTIQVEHQSEHLNCSSC